MCDFKTAIALFLSRCLGRGEKRRERREGEWKTEDKRRGGKVVNVEVGADNGSGIRRDTTIRLCVGVSLSPFLKVAQLVRMLLCVFTVVTVSG